MIRLEINSAARGLACGEPFVGGLDAVIDGVAHKMHQRLAEGVENTFVEIGMLAGDVQSHVLAALLGDVADDARKAAEELLDRHHANFEDAFVQFIENARLKAHGIGELCAERIARVALVEFGERAMEHGLADNQFTDEIHDGIDATGIDAKSALSDGSHGGGSLAGFRGIARVTVLCGIGDNLRRLGIQ